MSRSRPTTPDGAPPFFAAPHVMSLVSPSAPRRIVITGTGTGIGKTFVAAQLLELLRSAGLRCLGLKPLETGYVDPHESDAATLAQAAAHALVPPLLTCADPISPHRAARSLGAPITPGAVRDWVTAHIAAAPPDVALIETAGGLFSPVDDCALNIDVVRALEPCTFVLVAPDRLGGLHDVLCGVTAARAVFRAPDAVCMNLQEPAAASLENTLELRRFANLPRLFQAPLTDAGTRDSVLTLLLGDTDDATSA